jgi:hypothetical protein
MKLKRTEVGYVSQCGRLEFYRVAILTKSGKPKHGWRLFFNDRPVSDRLLDSLDECKQLAQATLDAQPQPEPPTWVGGFGQSFRYIE